MTDITLVPVFLDRDRVADELGITPLEVQRLYARGHLTAHRVGNRLLIDPDDLRRYVRSGAPDLHGLELSQDWILLPDARHAESEVRKRLKQLMRDNLPETPPLDAAGNPRENVTMHLPAKVKALADTPFARAVRFVGEGAPERFSTFGEGYVINRLHATAWAALREARAKHPAEEFYSSPETYKRIADEAWSRLDDFTIKISEIYQLRTGQQQVNFILKPRSLGILKTAALEMAY